ncbi:MAG: hypothetical protein AABY10_03955 [Nanoarchaeota archaeon]
MSLIKLISNNRRKFRSVGEAAENFSNLNEGVISRFKNRIVEDVPKYLGWGVLAGAIGALTAGGAMCGSNIPPLFDKQTVPMYGGFMQKEDNREITAREMSPEDRNARFEILGRRIGYVQERLSTWSRSNEYYVRLFEDNIFVGDTHQLNPRFVAAFAKSCYVNQEEAKIGYNLDGEARETPMFTPEFMETWASDILGMPKEGTEERERRMTVAALPYLRKLATPNRPVVDAYAYYFAGEDGVRKAIAKTGSINYYPDLSASGESISKGYREALPVYQKTLIEDADLLYEISDEGKKINWKRLGNYRDGGIKLGRE